MREIQNPILRGFIPDPSIIRVGEDYYIATSTFEWLPGVQIHHSTDLVNWNVISHPLNRVSPNRIEFNNESLDINFQSLSSIHEQSLVARRAKAFSIEMSTKLEFNPDNFQQLAGLVFYYNTGNFYYSNVSTPKEGRSKQAYEPAFTGCFVGIAYQDLAHQTKTADFEWFEYKEL